MPESLSQEAITQVLIIGSLSTLSFVVALLITPIFTHFAFKYKFWKKMRDTASLGKKKEKTPVYASLHKGKHKRNIPTMAGVIIWGTVLIITLLFNLDRNQTWLPLFTLVSVGFLGLFDDIVNIKSIGGHAGIASKIKMAWLLFIATVGAFWFFNNLGYTDIYIPFVGDIFLGALYIPFFILVFISSANAVNITDGLDGLSGGLLSTAFFAFLVIAFFQGNYGIAIFCGTLMGAVLAYTWFNIYPARFFMGDTGAVSLGATLAVVAMLTHSALILPIIGFIFVVETFSVILQVLSKRIRKKKIFLSAPIHHHLEARGWPETKITMRFWVIGAVMSIVGLILRLIGI